MIPATNKPINKLSTVSSTVFILMTCTEYKTVRIYSTLFFNIDGEWNNCRFNGKLFNINILEKHVKSALSKENIPDF